MQKAIIDTKTQVIKRLTTDNIPRITNEESIIELDTPITLNGFTKININTKELSTPTEKEIIDAKVDDEKNAIVQQKKVEDLNKAIDAIIDDKNISNTLINYFKLLKDLK